MLTPSSAHLPSRHRVILLSLLTLGYTLLIVYGTLFPLSGWDWSRGDLSQLIDQGAPRYFPYGDFATNTLVYMPLGFLLTLLLLGHLPLSVAMIGAALAGGMLSFTLEYLQLFLPNRISALPDVVLNTLGTFAGVLLATLVTRQTAMGRQLHVVRQHLFVAGRLADLGVVVIAAWALSQLVLVTPLIARVIHRGHFLFSGAELELGSLDYFTTTVVALNIAGLGLLCSTLLRSRHIGTIIFGVMAALVLFTRSALVDEQISLTDIAGAGIGIGLCLACLGLRTRQAAIFGGLFLALAVFIAQLQPGAVGVAVPVEFNWVPFQGQLRLAGVANVLEVAWPFAALAYVAAYLRRLRGWGMPLLGTAVILIIMLLLEWNQRLIPGRQPDITDGVLATLAWLLPWLHPEVRDPRRRPSRNTTWR